MPYAPNSHVVNNNIPSSVPIVETPHEGSFSHKNVERIFILNPNADTFYLKSMELYGLSMGHLRVICRIFKIF